MGEPTEVQLEISPPTAEKKRRILLGIVFGVLASGLILLIFLRERQQEVLLRFQPVVGEKVVYNVTLSLELAEQPIATSSMITFYVENVTGNMYTLKCVTEQEMLGTEEFKLKVDDRMQPVEIEMFGTEFSNSLPVTVQGGYPTDPLKVGESWSTPLDYNLSFLGFGDSRITGTIVYRLKSVEKTVIAGKAILWQK